MQHFWNEANIVPGTKTAEKNDIVKGQSIGTHLLGTTSHAQIRGLFVVLLHF